MQFSDKIGKLTLAAALAVACTAQVGGSRGNGPQTSVTSGGSAGDGSSATAAAGKPGSAGNGSVGGAASPAALLNLPAAPLPAMGLHKLTSWEFANSVQDLLGSGVPLAPVEADTLINGFATVGASSVSISKRSAWVMPRRSFSASRLTSL